MVLEMNEELLFMMLFFGFRRFPASLTLADSKELPSPKAGADLIECGAAILSVTEVPPPSLPGI